MPQRTVALFFSLIMLFALLLAVSCMQPGTNGVAPTATPDYVLLETRTEARLAATLTAKAPTATQTATMTPAPPTETPLPTATPTPTEIPLAELPIPLLVHVQRTENDATNIVIPDMGLGGEEVLTHFTEPWSIYSLIWSKTGDRLAFISSHAFWQSRRSERNVFVMRPDGSDLRMVTGQYVSPADVEGPFVTLMGQITGARGICRVSAQGVASPVEADETGQFALPGVCTSAGWARAVCQDGAVTYQGDTTLNLEESLAPINIIVEAKGHGWRDLSLAPDGMRLVATQYEWKLDDDGNTRYNTSGVIYHLDLGRTGYLELPDEKVFHGASWSRDGQRIVGGLSDEEGAYLWEWDALGHSVGALFEIENPSDEMLSIVRPVWSPHDMYIAFELHRWYWWADPRFRTDLVMVDAEGEEMVTLVTNGWGQHATHASWGASEAVVFYQFTELEADLLPGLPPHADIWSVPIAEPTPFAWTEDGASYLPAVRPPLAQP